MTLQRPHIVVHFAATSGEQTVLSFESETWSQWLSRAAVLVGLCVVAYFPGALGAKPLPGDDAALTANPYTASWSALRPIWLSPQHLPFPTPLSDTLFLAEWRGLGLRNFWMARTIGIALHAVVSLLLWQLLRRLRVEGAWLGAALFALHPMQVDAVAWVAQQRWLLCGVFYLLTLLVFGRWCGLNPADEEAPAGMLLALPQSRRALYRMAVGLFLAALLSHVAAATFPLVVLILIAWKRGRIEGAEMRGVGPFAALAAVAVGLTAAVTWRHGGELWPQFPGVAGWLIVVGRGVWGYLGSVVMPMKLSFAHPRLDGSALHPWEGVLLLAAVGVVVALWLLRERVGRGPITCGALFVCLLLPAAVGVVDPGALRGAAVSDHAAYFALAPIAAGAAALISLGLRRTARVPVLRPVAIVVLLGALLAMTVHHSLAYRTPVAVWTQVLDVDPRSAVADDNLARLELLSNDTDQAEWHLRRALEIDANDPATLLGLADVAGRRGEWDKAIGNDYRVLQEEPNNRDAHFGLAIALTHQGDIDGAMQQYATVLKSNPNDADAYVNMGLVERSRGNLEAAIADLRRAIGCNPRMTAAYIDLANLLVGTNQVSAAIDTLHRALEIDPASYEAWMNLGAMAGTDRQYAQAERAFRVAISLHPSSAEAFVNLARVLLLEGDAAGHSERAREALYCAQRAVELNPNVSQGAEMVRESRWRVEGR